MSGADESTYRDEGRPASALSWVIKSKYSNGRIAGEI
jgi:hypothetical protein